MLTKIVFLHYCHAALLIMKAFFKKLNEHPFVVTLGIIASIITIVTGIHYFYPKTELDNYDLVAPNITFEDALSFTKSIQSNISKDYELIDAIGSYYICVRKPKEIFHLFPEWTFVFRSRIKDEFIEIRVSDSRLPQTPLNAGAKDMFHDGSFSYYIVPRTDSFFISRDDNYFLNTIDNKSRTVSVVEGKVSKYSFGEIIDGSNSYILARAQIYGRPTDKLTRYQEVIDIEHSITIVLRKATVEMDDFFRNLKAIPSINVTPEEAVIIAKKKGAVGFTLGQEKIGGPGVFRLNDGQRYGLEGAYWDIPYRIMVSPVLINVETGDLYTIPDDEMFFDEH